MAKSTLFFFQILLLAAVACGNSVTSPLGSPLSTPEPAPESQPSHMPEPELPSTGSPEVEPGTEAESAASIPEGLQVVYIREGNLWSWTEAGGSAQLTNSGDMSTARLSPDGQLLAFMRGREIWTVRMDGKNARLRATQAEAGGALWFAPNGAMLAVSTGDHIDVVDLTISGTTTAISYPSMPDDYFPEVVWSPDGAGFKTVIPPQAETGQAELLYVFTDGTIASLAKFSILPLSESLPFISPDGGYVIYAAKMGDGRETLYLMDSSGAAKPYGKPGANVRAYGWLPDSKRFMYGWDKLQHNFIGNVNGPPAYNETIFPPLVRWVKNEHYLALDSSKLILGDLSGTKSVIDSAVTNFDFVD